MPITPEYRCSRCGEVFKEPEITNRIDWKPAEIMREIIENNEEVYHICEDGMGLGEFIGLRLDGEWIEMNRRERAKLYKKEKRMVKVIRCKLCDDTCMFPCWGFHPNYPERCPYGDCPETHEFVEEEIELEELINFFAWNQ